MVHSARRAERDRSLQHSLSAENAAVRRSRGRSKEAGEIRILEITDVVPLAIAVRDPSLVFTLAQRSNVVVGVKPLKFLGGSWARYEKLLRGQGPEFPDQIQRQGYARNTKRMVAAVGMSPIARSADQHSPSLRRDDCSFELRP